jgi:hypothetical protein
MALLKREESHKVIAQGLASLLRLGQLLPSLAPGHHRLVAFAKQVTITWLIYHCGSELLKSIRKLIKKKKKKKKKNKTVSYG